MTDIAEDYFSRAMSADIYDLVRKTALDPAPVLSARIGRKLWLKREDMQATHSFKLRGAYNCIRQLSENERSKGVVAASAGNHAQGVALAARELGINPSTLFRKMKSLGIRLPSGNGASPKRPRLRAAK